MSQTATPGQSLLSLRQAGAQVGSMMGSMNPRQRLIVAGGVIGVLVLLAMLILRANQPRYTVLYANLQPNDAQQVTAKLDMLAIPYQTGVNGASISVPEAQLSRARLALAAAGLPHSNQQGFELFDKTNWSGSDFAEQVNYQRALEGQLERTIESMDDVRTAQVQITQAHDSLFTTEERPAKAAVVVNLRDGELRASLVSAIRHLVAGAVDHLAAQDVSVMDARGQVALSSGQQTQSKLESDLQAKIIATLAPIVGAAHVHASVAVAYDPTASDQTQETYNPAASAVVSSNVSRTGPAVVAPASGVPGTTSNLPTAQAPGTNFKAQLGLSGPQGQETQSQTFAVSRDVTHTTRAAGSIQRLTAAVVVDDATRTQTQGKKSISVDVPRSPAEMQQLQALAAAAIGLNPARGDVLTISNLPFYTPSASPAAPSQPAAPVPWSDRLPVPLSWIAAALGALLLVVLALAMTLRGHPPAAQAPAPSAQLGVGEAMAPATPHDPATQAAPPEVEHEVLNMTELLEADPDATPPEVAHVLQLKERLSERVRREPAIAGRLIQGWMNKHQEVR